MKYTGAGKCYCEQASLPTRECGLKFENKKNAIYYQVTPYAGVWIEIRYGIVESLNATVTPYAGVWIEMVLMVVMCSTDSVTPYAGVWIEIILYLSSL